MKSSFKKAISSIFLVVLSISFYAQSVSTYNIDKVNSVIHWKGYKPMGSQSGTIKLLSGFIEADNAKLTEGNFVAKMNTIKDDGGSPKLERHLKSVDFFDVEAFPTASFKITAVNNKNDKIYLVGALTIKGITKQIEVPSTLAINKNTIKITTDTFKINRADFNIKYKSKSFFANLKDKFIHDDFDLQVVVIANK